MLCNDAAQGIGNEHTHHVALLFEPLLIGLEFNTTGTDKKSIGLTTSQLTENNFTHIKVWQLPNHKEAKLRTEPLADLLYNRLRLLIRRIIGLSTMITHLLVDVGWSYPKVCICQRLMCHCRLKSAKDSKKASTFANGVCGGVSQPLESTKLG